MMHPRILKELRYEIALPLKLIFDMSIKTKTLPKDWRSGNISPIYKKGKKCYVNNYRPVSLTCILCKILESIIRDNILQYFIDNKLFSNRQYGFIKGRSTVTQLLNILDKWTECLENGGQVDVIYTDLEKAFDKVPHKLLIRKLIQYKINPTIVEWIKAFLTNRRQRVKVNDCFSIWASVISGIPQGSILGPLLFIIYINDLVDVCSSGSEMYLYADDTKLFRYISDRADMVALQSEIDNLHNWIKNWLLKLNIDKCKVVSFGRNINIDTHYTIDSKGLEKLDSIKDLGVYFDSKLRFNLHLNEKVNKAYSVLGILNRNFRYVSAETFVLLYKSMVRSHLEYANSVWCPYRQEDIKTLEKVQMRATRLVRSIKHLSYTERLKQLKLPTLKFRRIRGDMIEVYKIVTGKYDTSLSYSIMVNSDSVTRGNRYKLIKEHVRYDVRKYFFTNRVVDIWNSLPDSIVSADSINIFKNRLDKLWCNQDLFFNYESELTGTGNRSESKITLI